MEQGFEIEYSEEYSGKRSEFAEKALLWMEIIAKGMPIEQVQKILGHEQIDTTLRYAMVNQNNVKMSHRKYIS